jgi:hypothetical protein
LQETITVVLLQHHQPRTARIGMENSSENNNLGIESIGSVGAPKGNDNAKKGKLFFNELRKALVQQDQLNLRRIADKLVEKAIEGEPWAVKEIMDRVDGKAIQATEISGTDGEDLKMVISWQR